MSLVRTVLDIESAFGKHPDTGEAITLSCMTTEEYLRHPLFRLHGIGVKIDKDKTFYIYKPDDVVHFLKNHPWNKSYVIGHHVQFDGAVLSWLAGISPAFWGCTLSMSRAVFPWEPHTLESLAERLGLPPKGKELSTVKDKWVLTDQEQKVLGDYCINDVDLTAAAFDAMVGKFPPSELRLVDLNTRLFTEPVIVVDRSVLVDEYRRERRAERALLKQCGVDKSVLASNNQFAELLLSLDVNPPKKLSPSKVKDGRVNPSKAGKAPRGVLPTLKALTKTQLVKALGEKVAGFDKAQITTLFAQYKAQVKEKKRVYPWAYAFGKADEEFKMLEDHPSPHIRDLVAARLNVKSTIKETRSKRFYKIGKRGAFPVYHKYYGAKTGRDCLVGSTEIYVLRGGEVCSILLPELLPDDLVWDGVEFVAHGGLLDKGFMEVITYDGITGTPDHRVYCGENEEEKTLREATKRGDTLKVADPPPGISTNFTTEY